MKVSRLSKASLWLWSVIAIALVWGCLIRFYDLGAELYWEDETFTALRIAGYTREELTDANFQGQVIYPADLLKFQAVNADRDLSDTVASLADDTHPPLYFVMLRLWAERFGSSTTTLRTLSAVVGLLLIPSVYWLAVTLFEGWPQRHPLAGLSAALVAVSPYHMAVASESRMYSLLTVLTTLSAALLLRALRRDRPLDWLLYGLVATASLYVHWLSVPVLFGYGLYVVVSKGLVWQRARSRYLLTSALTALSAVPWLLFVGQRINKVYYQTRWTGEEIAWLGPDSVTQLWLKHAALLFFNDEMLSQQPGLQGLIGLLCIGLMAWGMVFAIRHTPKSIWAFLLIVSGIIFGPLAIADLTLGGQRSAIFRYLVPSLTVIEIAVAFCLIALSRVALSRAWPLSSAIARFVIIALLIGGFLSQTVAKVSFTPPHPLVQVANKLNSVPRSRLIADPSRPTLLLPLAHLLAADTQLQLTIYPDLPSFSTSELEDRTAFLYQASEPLKAVIIAQGYNLRPVPEVADLLQLKAQ